MATNKPKAAKVPANIADDVISDIEFSEIVDPENIALDRAIRSFGDAAGAVNVYRQGPGGHRDIVFLFSSLPTEWLTDGPAKIQREYGGGTFRIHMQDSGGQMKINTALKIESLPKKEMPQIVAASGNEGIMAAIHAMTNSIGELAKVVMANRVEPVSPLQTLDGIRAVAEMFRPAQMVSNAPPVPDFMTVIGAAKTLIEISKGMGPELPEGTNAADAALLKGIDLFGKMVDHGRNQQTMQNAQPKQIAAVSANPVAENKQEEVPETLTQEEAEMLIALKVQLKMANRAAESGADPEEFAEDSYGMMPDDMFAQLLHEQWFDALCNVNADCAGYKEWYGKARNKLLAMAREDKILTDAENPVSVPPLPEKSTETNGDTHT